MFKLLNVAEMCSLISAIQFCLVLLCGMLCCQTVMLGLVHSALLWPTVLSRWWKLSWPTWNLRVFPRLRYVVFRCGIVSFAVLKFVT